MCISQSTPIAKATAILRLTRQKLYTADEVLEQVINGSDIELDDYSDKKINGPFDNEEDYQLSLDVQGEHAFEPTSSNDDESEVSSHSTAPLDPENAKVVTWYKKEFDQPDVPWLHDTSTKANQILLASNHLFAVGNPVRHMTLNFTKELVQEFQQSILT